MTFPTLLLTGIRYLMLLQEAMKTIETKRLFYPGTSFIDFALEAQTKNQLKR